MTDASVTDTYPAPTIVPLGDSALLVRFGTRLTDPANRAAIALADLLESMSRADFISQHNAQALRVLATGFAPGFVYCGLHADDLIVPRRAAVRAAVPPGTVLFAAGQTAITATELPTGWHILGHTDFTNFDPGTTPATQLKGGDHVRFTVAT